MTEIMIGLADNLWILTATLGALTAAAGGVIGWACRPTGGAEP